MAAPSPHPRADPAPGARPAPRRAWRADGGSEGERILPEETPVALVYDASTYAVMMATPADLEDFGVGFTLTEGIGAAVDILGAPEVVAGPLGAEVRLWLAPGRAGALAGRRRRLAGPTGCGLCGIESLEEAARVPLPVVHAPFAVTPAALLAAMADLAPGQTLGGLTRATHAAGFWTPAEGIVAVREDVGRHNALDKLAGALARAGRDASGGVVLLTSRVSVEMVQKAAAVGAPVLAAVSAPTTLAVETAHAAGVTLCAVVRPDGFEVFTHPDRIAWP